MNRFSMIKPMIKGLLQHIQFFGGVGLRFKMRDKQTKNFCARSLAFTEFVKYK